MRKFKLRHFFAALIVLAVGLGCAAQTEPARISYSRAFPGSEPAFFQVTINQAGAAQFRGREKDDSPEVSLAFTAPPDDVTQYFALATALNDFEKPVLESKTKVAFSGNKTLEFAQGATHFSQTFNYTTNASAGQLIEQFEKIGATGIHVVRLQRVMRFDHLGVGEEMAQLEADWNNNLLAAPQLLIPVLRQLSDGTAYLASARKRASDLLAQMPPQ